MSLPSIEARVAAQERLTTMLHARIEELSSDVNVNFREMKQDQHASFKQVDAYLGRIEEDIAAIKARQAEHGQKLDSMQEQLTQILTLLISRKE